MDWVSSQAVIVLLLKETSRTTEGGLVGPLEEWFFPRFLRRLFWSSKTTTNKLSRPARQSDGKSAESHLQACQEWHMRDHLVSNHGKFKWTSKNKSQNAQLSERAGESRNGSNHSTGSKNGQGNQEATHSMMQLWGHMRSAKRGQKSELPAKLARNFVLVITNNKQNGTHPLQQARR